MINQFSNPYINLERKLVSTFSKSFNDYNKDYDSLLVEFENIHDVPEYIFIELELKRFSGFISYAFSIENKNVLSSKDEKALDFEKNH